MSDPQWTPEELAVVHQEMLLVADSAAAIAAQWNGQAGSDDALADPGDARGWLPAGGGRGPFSLSVGMNEGIEALRKAKSDLLWTIAAPAVLTGWLTAKRPFGFDQALAARQFIAVLILVFSVTSFWSWLLRQELSGRPWFAMGWEPYSEGAKGSKRPLVDIGVIGASALLASLFCASNGAAIFDAGSPLGLALIWAGIVIAGVIMLYSAPVVMMDGRSVREFLSLFWPPPWKLVLGLSAIALWTVGGAAMIGGGLAKSMEFPAFNILAALGTVFVFVGLVVFCSFAALSYRYLTAGR